MTDDSVLLVATVGGDPEPVVTAMQFWRPARVCLVVAERSAAADYQAVLSLAAECGVPLAPAHCDTLTIPDPDNLRACIGRLRRLTADVLAWMDKGAQYVVSVDLSAGTKSMSAALALHARRWPCAFSCVAAADHGGDTSRYDLEDVVHAENPWDALGYQAVEDACDFFNRGFFLPAAVVLATARERANDAAITRELMTLEMLARAYADWDRFDQPGAAGRLANVVKNGNDLRAVFGPAEGDRLLDVVRRHRDLLAEDGTDPVADLVANAMRRAQAGRYDDAVARLYRAVEALAQEALRSHGMDTSHVRAEQLPDDLRYEWASRVHDDEVRLGAQDAYRLLAALGHELGTRFMALRLHELESPLSARNQSILAHGFVPMSEAAYRRLLDATLALAGFQAGELTDFPQLVLVPEWPEGGGR